MLDWIRLGTRSRDILWFATLAAASAEQVRGVSGCFAMPRKKTAKTKKSHNGHARSELPSAHKRSGRPIWQGHLRLSLVSCPVALYGATTRASDVSFHLLNPETNNRIRMVPTDPESG